MAAWLDVCRFTPTLGGTTDWTFSAAVVGYQSPALAGVVNGRLYKYRAESADLSQWEIGEGAYNTATGVLARTTVLYNSSGTGTAAGQSGAGTKISFTVAPQVAVVAIKEDLLSIEEANSFSATQKSQGQANLGIPAKNYIINPSGEINQRGAGSQADVTYDFDRWLTLTQTAAITASQVADAENTTPFMMRSLQAQVTAQRYGRIQWFEKLACRDLRGQAVTLSARVRMSASTTLRYAIIEWTGTADTITKDIVLSWTSGTFTAGNFFTTTSTTIVATGSIALTANTLTDITTLTGTVSSSMNNLAVFFWTDSTQAQNVTLDIAKVKLENGAVATPFAARTTAEELRDCQRYFYKRFGAKIDDGFGMFQVFSTTKGWGPVMALPAVMRVAGTITQSAVADFSLWATNAAAEIPATAMSLFSTLTTIAATSVTVASGLVAGSATIFSANSTSAWMAVDSEL